MVGLQIWRKAWSLLDAREKRNAWIILGVIITSALSSALMVVSIMPFLMVLGDTNSIENEPVLKWVYERLNFQSDYLFVVMLGIGSLAVIILASILQVVRTWAVARFSLMRTHALSQRLLQSYMQQPYEHFLGNHSGEMGTRVLSESEQVVIQFIRPAGEAIAAAVTILSITVTLIFVSPAVAVLSMAILGGTYGATFLLSRKLVYQHGKARVEGNSQRYRLANEALGGIKDIKLICREEAYIDRFKLPSYKVAKSVVAIQLISQIPQYVMQAVALGGIIVLCLLLLDPVSLSSGKMITSVLPLIGVFAFGGQRLLPELSRLYAGLTQLNGGAASVDAVYADLNLLENSSAKSIDHIETLGLKHELKLENVSYLYSSSGGTGIREVSMTINAGEKIGIVGTTGAGKTTLVNVMLGLLPPQSGVVKTDGIVVNRSNLRSWFRTVGFVPQDIYLTDSTIAENIALGYFDDEIDFDRLRRSSKMAKLDEFVTNELPYGYQTVVGERGVRLSGGQKQRIGIARALYNNADLIVFDEATSSLDNLTEQEVMSSVDNLPGDKTVIMIAHRLSTLEACDRIAVMNAGKLHDVGTWDELLVRSSIFKSIAYPKS